MAKAKEVNSLAKIIPSVFQVVLNICLSMLALVLSIMLIIEIVHFIQLLFVEEKRDYKYFLANILVFFLYFEFITMIVKYFKEDYHFPLRYFMYIGITAMVRLIIVEHDHAMDTLLYSLVILVLIIGYYIINITPRERPLRKVTGISKIEKP
jgi:protein PsiE